MTGWDPIVCGGLLSRGQQSGLLSSQQAPSEGTPSGKCLHEVCFIKMSLAVMGEKDWKGRDGRQGDQSEG